MSQLWHNRKFLKWKIILHISFEKRNTLRQINASPMLSFDSRWGLIPMRNCFVDPFDVAWYVGVDTRYIWFSASYTSWHNANSNQLLVVLWNQSTTTITLQWKLIVNFASSSNWENAKCCYRSTKPQLGKKVIKVNH